MRAALLFTNIKPVGLDADSRSASYDAQLNDKATRAAAYMPNNYEVIEHQHSLYLVGDDHLGWTLDGYVVDRLGSGCMSCVEVTDTSTLQALAAKRDR